MQGLLGRDEKFRSFYFTLYMYTFQCSNAMYKATEETNAIGKQRSESGMGFRNKVHPAWRMTMGLCWDGQIMYSVSSRWHYGTFDFNWHGQLHRQMASGMHFYYYYYIDIDTPSTNKGKLKINNQYSPPLLFPILFAKEPPRILFFHTCVDKMPRNMKETPSQCHEQSNGTNFPTFPFLPINAIIP